MALVELTLLLFFAFQVKHFAIDFPLQYPYQWRNKGTYGHPGGILHSSLHSIGTFAILIFFFPAYLSALLALFDGVIHYHIDWAKMNINRIKGWGANTHPEFWNLVGLDQMAHQVTYLIIIYLAFIHK